MPRGGTRVGAGRPPKTPVVVGGGHEDAEAFLLSVMGDERLDVRTRMAAASILLPFQTPRRRARPKSQTPRHMAALGALAAEREAREDWAVRERAVREQHAKKKG